MEEFAYEFDAHPVKSFLLIFPGLLVITFVSAVIATALEWALPSIDDWMENLWFTMCSPMMIFPVLYGWTTLSVKSDAVQVTAKIRFAKWEILCRREACISSKFTTRGERWLAHAAKSFFSRLEITTSAGKSKVVLGALICWLFNVGDKM